MAAQKTQRAGRVADAFDTLAALCEKAEAAKDAPKPVQDFTKAVGKLTAYVDGMNGSAAAVVEALMAAGEDIPNRWQQALSELRVISSALVTKGEDVDREEGDRKAKALRSMVDAELLEDDDVDPAKELVERWSKSAPSKGGRTSSGSSTSKDIAPLGFTVQVACQKTGCEWSARTSQDNLNSIRRQAQVHSDKVHGQPMVNGEPLHQGITEALCSVGMSGRFERKDAVAAEGGSFTVTRVAAS